MIKYLENCVKINEFQVKQLKCRVVENNWDLLMEDDCGSVVHDKANFMQKELTARWPPLEEFTV
jgi:hypothetical protein